MKNELAIAYDTVYMIKSNIIFQTWKHCYYSAVMNNFKVRCLQQMLNAVGAPRTHLVSDLCQRFNLLTPM